MALFQSLISMLIYKMNKELIFPILSILGVIVSCILALYTHKPRLYMFAVIFILITAILPPSREILDSIMHKSANRQIKSKFPDDLDFFTHRIVRFNKGANFGFDSEDVEANINLTRIYQRDGAFFIHILFNVEDKKHNTAWIDQEAEVELSEGNLVIGKTDRLDFYFYVKKTFLGNAEIYIGVKETLKGLILKNLRIKGKSFNFK